MSASTDPIHKPKRHPLVHHARQPHGLLVIGVILFVLAWSVWTFLISPWLTR